jgi:hypothetical protein
MRRCLLAVVLLAVVPAPASAEPGHKVLKHYVREVAPVIQSYRSVAGRAEEVLSTEPSEDLEPLVEGLSDVSVRFDRLAKRWQGIKAPPGLGLKHRGMGGAFHLQAQAFLLWANAWNQVAQGGDLETLVGVNEHAAGLLHHASYLQRRWAAALSGALVRAYLPVPRWLEQMAMVP